MNRIDVSQIKLKPEFQRLIDQNGPVLTPEDRINRTEKYLDWLEMDHTEWREKYLKNLHD
jgi:hypothetical protein